MINRKLHIKDVVYFIHDEYGVCGGKIKALTDTHATILFKPENTKLAVSVPLEDLSLNPQELKNQYKWSAKHQNIPKKYAEDFENISWEGDVIRFLYNNLKKDAKSTARILIENYYGWDVEDEN